MYSIISYKNLLMASLTRTDFLTSIQLENIKKHEYKSTGYTVFDHVLDRYFWNQLEYYLPEVYIKK